MLLKSSRQHSCKNHHLIVKACNIKEILCKRKIHINSLGISKEVHELTCKVKHNGVKLGAPNGSFRGISVRKA